MTRDGGPRGIYADKGYRHYIVEFLQSKDVGVAREDVVTFVSKFVPDAYAYRLIKKDRESWRESYRRDAKRAGRTIRKQACTGTSDISTVCLLGRRRVASRAVTDALRHHVIECHDGLLYMSDSKNGGRTWC